MKAALKKARLDSLLCFAWNQFSLISSPSKSEVCGHWNSNRGDYALRRRRKGGGGGGGGEEEEQEDCTERRKAEAAAT
jgi:hypothetical protein